MPAMHWPHALALRARRAAGGMRKAGGKAPRRCTAAGWAGPGGLIPFPGIPERVCKFRGGLRICSARQTDTCSGGTSTPPSQTLLTCSQAHLIHIHTLQEPTRQVQARASPLPAARSLARPVASPGHLQQVYKCSCAPPTRLQQTLPSKAPRSEPSAALLHSVWPKTALKLQ